MGGKRRLTIEQRENRKGYLFTIPWVIGFALFFLYPLVFSIRLAFSRVTDLQSFTMVFNGVNNFSRALLEDVDFVPKLLESLSDTAIRTPIVVVFALFIAILLNQKIRLRGLYRALFLLPVIIGAGVVMQTLQGNSATLSFSPGGDMMNSTTVVENTIDIGVIELSDRLVSILGRGPAAAVETVLEQISAALWMSGIQIILFLGALQSIPDMYYEAAMCDGATAWEKFWKITLPMITPTILIVVVFTLISYFTSADNTVMAYVTDTSFKNLKLDYGSAMGWLYFLIIGILLAAVFGVFRRIAFYQSDK